MNNNPERIEGNYGNLLMQISKTYHIGRQKAITAVNTSMIETYWKIGEYIVEFEQGGNRKTKYGKSLLENLSKDLNRLHNKGFSRSNLNDMRLFHRYYPICEERTIITLIWFFITEF